MITLVQKITTIISLESGYSWLLTQEESFTVKNGENDHQIKNAG